LARYLVQSDLLYYSIAASLALALAATEAFAQSYPAKPVRFIVPFAPGGGADLVARLVATPLSESLGQQVVVDNRGGASGIIGTEMAAKSAPDGYTMVLTSTNLAAGVSLYRKLPFDLQKDFSPVILLAKTPSILAVHPSLPVKTVQELIALAKSAPGKINYAGGVGTTLQLNAELFKSMAKIDLVHVPYNGTGPAVIGALSGEAPVILAPTLALLPHVKSGRLRALAITSIQRSAGVPDLPTVAESGVPGFDSSQWYGIQVPAGTPKAIVTRLNSECLKIVRGQEFIARLVKDASIPMGTTPQEFGSFLKSEIEKWVKVLKISGAKVE
jgi:tripartite-type tricarboxylate transporter receptor subunit TctC